MKTLHVTLNVPFLPLHLPFLQDNSTCYTYMLSYSFRCMNHIQMVPFLFFYKYV